MVQNKYCSSYLLIFIKYLNNVYWNYIMFLILFQPFLGGCGAIFEVFISSTEFKGLSVVKQHQLINEVNNHLILILQ